jgi:hypothetical protein
LGAGGGWGCGVVGCGVRVLRVGILAFLLGILLGFGWVEVDTARGRGWLLVVLFIAGCLTEAIAKKGLG